MRTAIPVSKATEGAPGEICGVAQVARGPKGKSLVVLQVNCRSICSKVLEFWNLIDTYNPDVVIGTESWLNEDVNNAEVFRGDYITGGIDAPEGEGYSSASKHTSKVKRFGQTRSLRL